MHRPPFAYLALFLVACCTALAQEARIFPYKECISHVDGVLPKVALSASGKMEEFWGDVFGQRHHEFTSWWGRKITDNTGWFYTVEVWKDMGKNVDGTVVIIFNNKNYAHAKNVVDIGGVILSEPHKPKISSAFNHRVWLDSGDSCAFYIKRLPTESVRVDHMDVYLLNI